MSKCSGIALLMLWAVNYAGGLNVQSTPIVNCSDVDTSQLLTVCENIVQMVLEAVDRDLVTYEGHRQHDLFYELTDLVIGMKQQIQSFLSTKVGVSKAHQLATGMQNMFARTEFSLAMHLGKSLINIFEAADRCDRLSPNTTTKNRHNENDGMNCCTICYDDFDEDAASLSSCNHQAFIKCWR